MDKETKPKLYSQDEPEITKFSDIDLLETYSYANYIKWKIDERLELIKGKIFEMRAPNRNHQGISRNMLLALGNFLKQKTCKVYAAPFDVRFTHESKHDEAIFTVLQPDICVVCDHNKLDSRGCIGAPDIVVEILSPGNNEKELKNKYKIYEEFGVREYWIINPDKRNFLKYTLNPEGQFEPSPLMINGNFVISEVLPGFRLNLNEIFEEVNEIY